MLALREGVGWGRGLPSRRPKREGSLACSSATVTSSVRRASVMVPHASNIVLITDRRSWQGWDAGGRAIGGGE